MFRRNSKKLLVAGLGLAALVAPSSALAGGSSSDQNVSPTASNSVRYGAPDGWTPYVESLTKASQASRYGAPDGWTPYVESLTSQSLPDGRSQDIATTEKAIALSKSLAIDGRSQDIATTEQALRLSRTVAPADGRSPDTIDAGVQAHSPFVTIIRTPGFQWGDFGIGTGVAFAAMILLALGMRRLSGRQDRKSTPVATA
jgi:hypothetical protein